MKKLRIAVLFLAVLALCVGIATAGPPDYFAPRNWSETQALTRAAPTLSTEGVAMNEAVSVTAVLDAGSTKTLSGAGSVNVWLYDKWDGTNYTWALFPNRVMSVPSACASQRYCVVDSYTIDGPRSSQRLLFAATGVTVSAGTNVVVMGNVNVSLRSASR
jgi:hypothetical protein